MADGEEIEISWSEPSGSSTDSGVVLESSSRGAWTAVGVVGAVLGLILMWSLIGGGGDDAAGPAVATTTSGVAATTSSAVKSTMTTIPAATMRPARTTTTTAVPGPFRFPSHPGGGHWNAELVVALVDKYVAVDLDSGRLRTLDWPKTISASGLNVDGHGGLIGLFYNRIEWFGPSGVATMRVEGVDPNGPQTWVVDGEVIVGRYTNNDFSLQRVDGEVLFEVDPNLYPVHVGERTVFETASGWVVVDTFNGEVVADRPGRLVAANDDYAVWLACEGLTCRNWAGPIDDLDSANSVEFETDIYYGDRPPKMLSPSGGHVAIVDWRNECIVAVYGLENGNLVGRVPCGDASNFFLAWSDDGSALFVVAENGQDGTDLSMLTVPDGDATIYDLNGFAPEALVYRPFATNS